MAVLPIIPYPPRQQRLWGANKSGVQAPERDFAVCETLSHARGQFLPAQSEIRHTLSTEHAGESKDRPVERSAGEKSAC